MNSNALLCMFLAITLAISSGAEAKRKKGGASRSGGEIGSTIAAAAAVSAFATVSLDTAFLRVFLTLDDEFLHIVTDKGKQMVLPRNELKNLDHDSFANSLLNQVEKPASGNSEFSLYIKADEYKDIKSLTKNRSNDSPTYLVSKDKTLRLKAVPTKSGLKSYLEYSKNLWLPAISISNIKKIDKLLQEKFDSRNVQIVSFFDDLADIDTVSALKKASIDAAGFKLVDSQKNIEKMFEGVNDKVVIMVGHIEGDSIKILDSAAKTKAVYSTKSVIEAARRNNNVPIVLGCESALIGGVGGFTCPVNSINVANDIGRALDSDTFGGFYNRLSGDSVLVVEKFQLSDIGMLIEGAIVRDPISVGKIGTRVAFWGSVQQSSTTRIIAWTFRFPVLFPVCAIFVVFAVPWRWTSKFASGIRIMFSVPPLNLLNWIFPVWIIWAPIVYPLLWLANLQFRFRQWFRRRIEKKATEKHA